MNRCFRFCLTLLLLQVGMLSTPATACPYDEPAEDQPAITENMDQGLINSSLVYEKNSRADRGHFGKNDCCCLCKVYSMKTAEAHLPIRVPLALQNAYPAQEKACRNANWGSWHPPKA
jgi:hypothetical protein